MKKIHQCFKRLFSNKITSPRPCKMYDTLHYLYYIFHCKDNSCFVKVELLNMHPNES